MKKLISLSILSLMLLNPISVQASTNDIIQVSLDNIEQIMIEYSPTLKIIDNNLEKAREDYKNNIDEIDDLEEDIKENDNKSEILGKEAQEAEKTQNTELKIEKEAKQKELKIKKEEKEAELKIQKEKKETNKHNLKIARTKYNKDVKQAVIAVQKQYVQYLDTISKKENKIEEVNIKNKQLEINKTKYDMGFISNKEYTTNSFDNTSLNSELDDLKNKEENELKDILLGLGLSNNEVKINTKIDVDIQKIPQINFEKDLQEMLDNSIDLEIKHIENDKVEDQDDVSDYVIDNNEIALKQEKDKIKLDFEKQYNTLKLSYDSLKNTDERLKKDRYDILIMNAKINYGFASQKQSTDLQKELNKKEADFISQKNSLYMNYLSYIQMKNGY